MSVCKISIIIPVYNGEQFLRQCLDAVLRQTLSEFEIILIDDASTDATQGIIDEYVVADKRINVVRQNENNGVSAARNVGIERATGEYITFLDADDYWMDDEMLASLYALASSNNTDIIDFGFIRSAEGDETRSSEQAQSFFIDMHHDKNWLIKYNIWAKLIRLSFLKKTKIQFDVSLVMGEDALFSTALYCAAKRLMTTGAEYYCYRINPGSVNRTPWNLRKLQDALNWCTAAVQLVKESEAYQRRPELLQTILRERIGMLYKKLGPLSLNIMNQQERVKYVDQWSDSLQYLDESYFTQPNPGGQAELQRDLYHLVIAKDYQAFNTFFNSEAYLSNKNQAQSVTISQLQANRLGQDLLQVNKPQIRCDFGGGVVITLPKDRAHQLAKQLIANQNPSITLRFN